VGGSSRQQAARGEKLLPYLIETFDKPGHAHVRTAARDEHLRYLDRNKNLLLACGAKLTEDESTATGGLYILDVEDRAAAETFIAADPFTAVDLFERVEIMRWRKAFFDFKNCLRPSS
jgi:uncharacterized protein YciI